MEVYEPLQNHIVCGDSDVGSVDVMVPMMSDLCLWSSDVWWILSKMLFIVDWIVEYFF